MEGNNIVLVGVPRGGTTYIGKVLEKTNAYTYFHEPFRINHGISSIDHWFPFSQSFNYSKIVDEFFNGSSKFVIKRHPQNKIWEYYLKKLIGNRDQVKYRKHFLHTRSSKSLLIKDPTASFLCDYIFNKKYAKIIIVVRHPMAFYCSVKQKRSEFDFKSLLAQNELIEMYLKEESIFLKNVNDLSYEQRAALLWRCIYKVLIAMKNKYADREDDWILVRHEDVCDSPLESLQTLCRRLNIQFTEETERFIIETSYNKGKILAKGNILHDFKRDSSALKDYWKKMVTDTETKNIYDITSDLASLFYDKSSWQNEKALFL